MTAPSHAAMDWRPRLARESDIPALEALIPLSVRTLQAPYYSSTQMFAGWSQHEHHAPARLCGCSCLRTDLCSRALSLQFRCQPGLRGHSAFERPANCWLGRRGGGAGCRVGRSSILCWHFVCATAHLDLVGPSSAYFRVSQSLRSMRSSRRKHLCI